ncbi:hypothetical protein K438DRAFT_1783442 [Mycena galopus ATCC 62051]|nr:hypothetical protein K438DRAFT_1783442 [Mycena galopus ATCC 62051]
MYPEAENFPEETQLYSGKRLLSSQGYSYPPLIVDTFQWQLPKSGTCFSREVETSSDGHPRRFELWSPNSVQLPFYPGIRSNVFDLKPAAIHEQRRYDRRLGRFDPTMATQYYNRRRPWLAFLLSPTSLSSFDLSTLAEFVPLIRVWDVSEEKPYLGSVRLKFVKDLEEANRAAQSRMMAVGARIHRVRVELWERRPIQPIRQDFDSLRAAVKFDEALDLCCEMQRGVQEKNAWARMAEDWLLLEPVKGTDLASVEILPANKEFLGTWIHGVEELDLKFFLSHASLIAEEPVGAIVLEDFVQGTPAFDLLDPLKSKFDHIALALNGGNHTLHDSSLPLPGVVPGPASERRLSGSLAQSGPVSRPNRAARSDSPDRVSIPESDEEEELASRVTVNTSPKWTDPPRSMILSTEVTLPTILGVSVTAILKLTVPDAFALDGVISWLNSATRLSSGEEWHRIVRVESKPRAHYYVEFDSPDAALHVKGLVNERDGAIRLVAFVEETEFQTALLGHPVATYRSSTVHSETPMPYPGMLRRRDNSPPRRRWTSPSHWMPPPPLSSSRQYRGGPALRGSRSPLRWGRRPFRHSRSRSRSRSPRRPHSPSPRRRSPVFRQRARSPLHRKRRTRSQSPRRGRSKLRVPYSASRWRCASLRSGSSASYSSSGSSRPGLGGRSRSRSRSLNRAVPAATVDRIEPPPAPMEVDAPNPSPSLLGWLTSPVAKVTPTVTPESATLFGRLGRLSHAPPSEEGSSRRKRRRPYKAIRELH